MIEKNHSLLLAIFIVFLIFNNILWFHLGGRPLHWDSAIHLSESLNANRIGSANTVSILKQILFVSWYYPPFVSYSSILLYKFFGESEFWGFQVMTLFLIVLVISVYGIGSMLFDREVGFLSAILVSACQIVIQFSRDFMLDLPLASMVALALYLLLKTDNFTKLTTSLVFGISLGLGMLTKWTFPIFVFFPLLFVTLKGLRTSTNRKTFLRNAILAIVVGILIATPWYLVHAVQIITSRSGELGKGEHTLFESISYYVRAISHQTSWLLMVVLIVGMIHYVKRFRVQQPFLIFGFVGAYILLSLISFKMPRFSIALLIPLIIMASAGIHTGNINSPVLNNRRNVAASLVTALVILQYLAITYVPAQSKLGRWLGNPILSAAIVSVDGPQWANWQQVDILQTVEEDRKSLGRSKIVVRVIPDHMNFNNATFEYLAKLKRYPITISGTTGFPLFTDYVVLKSADIGLDSPDKYREELTKAIIADTSRRTSMFHLMRIFDLPDGSQGILLRVEPQPAEGMTVRTVLETIRSLSDQFVRRYFKPITGYLLEVEGFDSIQTVHGRIKRIGIRMQRAEFGDFSFNPVGLPVQDVDIEITDVLVNPQFHLTGSELQVLSIRGLRLNNFSIAASDLKHYVEESSKGKITLDAVTISNGLLSLRGRWQELGKAFSLVLRLSLVNNENVTFMIEEAHVGFVPIPTGLLNALTLPFNPVITGLGSLSEVRIAQLTLSDDHLQIRGERKNATSTEK